MEFEDTRYRSAFESYLFASGLIVSLMLALRVFEGFHPLLAAQGYPLPPVAQEKFAAGTTALKRGDFPAAIQAFDKVLESDDRFAPAYLNLGLAYHSENAYDKAIESFSKALKLDKNLGSAALFLGIDYYETNQNPNAIEMLQEAVRLMPDRAKDVYPWLGKSFLSSGQFKSAIPYLEQAAESNPSSLTLQYNLARAHMLRSVELFSGIKRKNPQSYLVHLILADSYREQENFDLAIGEYENVLKVNPNLPGVHEDLGDIYWRKINYQEAEAEYASELRVDPYNLSTMYKLGHILTEAGKLDEAIACLEKVTKRNPSFADVYLELGKAWLRKGQFEESVANLERGITLGSANASAYLFLGQAYAKLGRTEKSQKALQMSQTLRKKEDEAVQDNFDGFVGTYGKKGPRD